MYFFNFCFVFLVYSSCFAEQPNPRTREKINQGYTQNKETDFRTGFKSIIHQGLLFGTTLGEGLNSTNITLPEKNSHLSIVPKGLRERECNFPFRATASQVTEACGPDPIKVIRSALSNMSRMERATNTALRCISRVQAFVQTKLPKEASEAEIKLQNALHETLTTSLHKLTQKNFLDDLIKKLGDRSYLVRDHSTSLVKQWIAIAPEQTCHELGQGGSLERDARVNSLKKICSLDLSLDIKKEKGESVLKFSRLMRLARHPNLWNKKANQIKNLADTLLLDGVVGMDPFCTAELIRSVWKNRKVALKVSDAECAGRTEEQMAIFDRIDPDIRYEIGRRMRSDSRQYLKKTEKRIMADISTDTPFHCLPFMNAKFLYFNVEAVQDLTPLAQLNPKAEYMQLFGLGRRRAADLSPLARSNGLKSLSLTHVGPKVQGLESLSSMKHLEALNFSSSVIGTLSFLSKMTSLKTLSLYHLNNPDLKPLLELENLRDLEIEYSTVDVGQLSAAKFTHSLKRLDLTGTMLVGKPANLAKFESLEDLDLHNSPIRDISWISELKRLKSVKLGRDVINLVPSGIPRNHYALVAHPTLESISLVGTVVDVTPLRHVPKLKNLDLSHTKLHNFDVLSGHQSLRNLNISGTNINDFSPLYEMPNLKNIKFPFSIGDEERTKLLKHLSDN